jgi:hypothetical protein
MRNPFRKQPQDEAAQPKPAEASASPAQVAAQILPLDFAPNDPLSAYLLSAGGPVDLERLKLDSPALDSLREAGVKLIAPLAGQGELIGLLNLGPRRSEQEYTADDRKLLGDLATQAAPAVRVAQLVRQQQIEAQARERLEQELRVARVVQQTLLPKDIAYKLSLLAVCQGRNRPKSDQFWTSFASLTGVGPWTERQAPLVQVLGDGPWPHVGRICIETPSEIPQKCSERTQASNLTFGQNP